MGLIHFFATLKQAVIEPEPPPPPEEVLITTDSTEYTIDTTDLYTIDTTDTLT